MTERIAADPEAEERRRRNARTKSAQTRGCSSDELTKRRMAVTDRAAVQHQPPAVDASAIAPPSERQGEQRHELDES